MPRRCLGIGYFSSVGSEELDALLKPRSAADAKPTGPTPGCDVEHIHPLLGAPRRYFDGWRPPSGPADGVGEIVDLTPYRIHKVCRIELQTASWSFARCVPCTFLLRALWGLGSESVRYKPKLA